MEFHVEHLESKTDPPTASWLSVQNSIMQSPGVAELHPHMITRDRWAGPHTLVVLDEVNALWHAPTRRMLGQVRWLAGEVVDCAECGRKVAAGETEWDEAGVLRHQGCVGG